MSRKGLKPISIPSGTTVTVGKEKIEVKGKLGSLIVNFPELIIEVKVDGDRALVTRTNEDKQTKMFHGTVASNLQNAIKGVSSGFQKKLKIVGVGYKAAVMGKFIEVHAGYSGSGPRKLEIPAGLKVTTPTPNEIIIDGFSKELVGQFAAELRDIRKPEPYKGKGIMYHDEIIIRKVGKTAESSKKK
jgi:large subunit ribosomal protein L6